MKRLWCILSILVLSCKEEQKSKLTLLADQTPTDTALVFGEGTVSTDNFEFAITFSPEMDEFFFTRRKPEADNEIFHSKFKDGKWSSPEVAFFAPETGWDFEPHINPKGDKLYFGSLRPVNDSITSGLHQWYCNKTKDGWSEPIAMESPLRDRFVMYLTSSEKGNLYFTSRDKEAKPGEGGIYSLTNRDGESQGVERLGEEINFLELEWKAHPFIAPDESYLIFDGESDSGYGENDLYISFNKNGKWTKAINMGSEINTEKTEMCASVSPDGKYLFFHRGVYIEDEEESGDIMWIDFVSLKKRLEEQTASEYN